MRVLSLQQQSEEIIRFSEYQETVKLKTIYIGTLNQKCTLEFVKVYINTRVLKHIYDKRTAQVYDFLLRNLKSVVTTPDLILRNRSFKRGRYCLVKNLSGLYYLAVVEVTNKLEVVTVFKTDPGYFQEFEVLWSWGVGNSHRNT